MSLETDVRYLLDRIEIQDKVALYGLGQDLHQASNRDKNILEQWSQLFAPDATIDLSDLGLRKFNLHDYAELMRGKGLKGGGLETNFKAWQHIEGHATVTINGDRATSISLHMHTHAARNIEANLFDVGYWHDEWVRLPEGWRILHRSHTALYTHTFPLVPNPPFLSE